MHDVEPKFIHISDVVPRPQPLYAWERQRHTNAHWLVELVAEATGVFCYTYAGTGSAASMLTGAVFSEQYLGSLLQVGFGYGIGIVLALVIAASTSGGHFNPCVTISLAIYKGFPWKKVPQYIVAQIFGAYIACLISYLQWRPTVLEIEAALTAAGTLDEVLFTPSGPAGIWALYTAPGANLGYVFANEFFCDFFIAMVIWACLDPSNFFAPPAAIPWIIGLTYSVCVWGYAPNGLATNAARDLGSRLMAMTIWGKGASGGNYAAVAALTNIVATVAAATFYEVFFHDSSRVLPPAQRDFLWGHKAHAEARETRYGPNANRLSANSDYSASDDKAQVDHRA